MENRTASVERVTKETKIRMTLNLDGTGKSDIHTGIGFFDHMLDGFARHGLFDLSVRRQDMVRAGKIVTERLAGVLAEENSTGDKQGIRRYGDRILPMDETLVLSAVDLCGRPYLSFQAEFTREKVGEMETEMVKEFFYAVSYAAQMNLHIKVLDGGNNHHIIEAMFKAFAKALDEATSFDPRIAGVLSTKGSL